MFIIKNKGKERKKEWSSLVYAFVVNFFMNGADEDLSPEPASNPSRSFFSRVMNPFHSMKVFWIIFTCISLIYIFLISGANLFLVTYAGYDDALYYNMAKSISGLSWLGPYQSLTLAKMPGYALFLSFCMVTGIPYLLLVSICYSIAIAFFLKQSMWIFDNNKLLSMLLGIVLLFNPLFNCVLHIYRHQFSSICFIVFLGVIAAMFNPNTRKERGFVRIIEALIASLGLGFLFYTREESLLYFGVLIVSISSFILIIKKIRYKWRNLYLLFWGLTGVLLLGLTISSLNYFFYGRFITCEKTSAPFTNAIQAFHSVDDPDLNPEFPKTTASKEKITKISEIIPEFKDVATIMCDSSNIFFRDCSTYFDRNELVFKRSGKNIPVSHFEWFWIACVKKAGYYANARKAASFYSDLDKKINGAFQSGLLKKRDVLIASGPYSVGSDDLKTLIRILPRNYFWLLQTPGSFAYNFNSFTVKQVHPANNAVLLAEWQNSLHVKYLHPIEKQKIIQENNSFMNKFWNFCVTFYAFIIIPLMHLTTPFALIVLIVGLFRKEWYSILLLVFVSSYIAHFLLLSVIDVSVGYQATSIAYFLPSYSTIIITTFISVSILISFFRKNQQPK